MSWTDQEIDELAKEAAGGMKFSYDPAFWTEAEALLPKKKAKVIWLYWTSAAAAAVVLTFGLFQFFDEDTAVYTARPLSALNDRGSVETKAGTNDLQEVDEYQMSNQALTAKTENSPVASKVGLDQQKGINAHQASQPVLVAKDLQTLKNDRANVPSLKRDVFAQNPVELNAKVSAPQIGLTFEPVDALPTNSLSFISVIDASVDDRLDGRFPEKRQFSTWFEVNFGVGQNPIATQSTTMKTFGFAASTAYNRGRASIMAGLEFEYQLMDMQLAETSNRYGFDLTRHQNLMNYRELYQLNIPIDFVYHLGRTQVGFGLAPNFQIGSKMDYNRMENGESQENRVAYGETRGLTTYGLTSSFGVGYKITENWTVGADLEMQMIQPVRSEMAEGQVILPMAGQVYIRKKLNRR